MNSKNQIADIRKEYSLDQLSENNVHRNPFLQFKDWFDQVIKSKIDEPNAMVLATSDKNGIPSARTVLLKSFDKMGFTFFTNYRSRKGRELIQNPRASLVFFWKELERQVRIDGLVEKLSRKESEEYFSQRPLESRIASIASQQSEVIPDRQFLEDKFEMIKQEYQGKNPLMPFDWGGFLVIPYRFEFWQGRENRLHDRILFEKAGNDWKLSRLSP
ncbi:MAG TPA: pyridoxamine 5'-phosphate oxidase [Ignavibacteriaceae bacterium]|nr:pyridoxamine 5'-phosphate oxidase [Ignavibacteriaceae bacterium]